MDNGAFIIGSARCGSTMLSNIVNAHPGILSISELFSTMGARAFRPNFLMGKRFWKRLSRPSHIASGVGNPKTMPTEFLYDKASAGRFDPYHCPPIQMITLPHLTDRPDDLFDHLARTVPTWGHASLARHYAHLFEELKAQCGGDVWVERSGGSANMLPTLTEFFPGARYVYLYRDGRDVALSMHKFLPMYFYIGATKFAERWGQDPFDPKNVLGRSLISEILAEYYGRTLKWDKVFQNQPSLEDCARFWSRMMMNALQDMKRLDRDKLLCLRYEDVIADPAPHLRAMEAFLGAPQDADWLERASAIPRNRPARWLALDPEDRRILTETTEETRAAYEDFLKTAPGPF